jgi:hypothetical protein
VIEKVKNLPETHEIKRLVTLTESEFKPEMTDVEMPKE